MSFIAGYIAGLGEGENYKNENKNITQNGEYIPDEGVRWDSVNVAVPNGEIIARITALPAIQGGTLNSGYRWLLHYGDIGQGTCTAMGDYPPNNRTTERTKHYATYYCEGITAFWLVLYRNNKDNTVVAATTVGNQISAYFSGSYGIVSATAQYEYSTRAFNEITLIDGIIPNGTYEEYEHYLYSKTKRKFEDVQATVTPPSKSDYRRYYEFKFKIHYTDEITYYKAYETSDTTQSPAPAGTVLRTETRTGYLENGNSIYIPFQYAPASFYSNLSASEFADEMINLLNLANS